MKRARMAVWIVASAVVLLACAYAFRRPRPVRAAAQASGTRLSFSIRDGRRKFAKATTTYRRAQR